MIDSDKRGASLTFSRMASTSTQSFLNSKINDKGKFSSTELAQLENIRKIKIQDNLSKISNEKVSEKPIVSNQSARKSINSSKYLSSNVSDSKHIAETEGNALKKDSEKNGLVRENEVDEDDKSGKENWTDEDEDMKRVLENIQKDLNVVEENKRGKNKSSFYFEKATDNWKRLNSPSDSQNPARSGLSGNSTSKQIIVKETEKLSENTETSSNSFLKFENDELVVTKKTDYSIEDEVFRKPEEPAESERYSPDLAEEEENELLGPAQSDDDNETDLDLIVDTDGPILDDDCDLDSNVPEAMQSVRSSASRPPRSRLSWEVIDEVASSSPDGNDEEMDTHTTETKIDSPSLNNPDSSPSNCSVSANSSKETPKLKMLLKLDPKAKEKRSSLDIPLFDSTGEEGMQEDVNRVVQQILVNISDEDVCSSTENSCVQDVKDTYNEEQKSNNCSLCSNQRHCSCIKKDSNLKSDTESTDKKTKVESVNNNTKSDSCTKTSNSSFEELLKDESLEDNDAAIKEEKPDVNQQNIKRKLDIVPENDEKSEVLTVKKVKLDTDLIHDEKKDIGLNKETAKVKIEIKKEEKPELKGEMVNEVKTVKPVKEEKISVKIDDDDDDIKIEKIEQKSKDIKPGKKTFKLTQSELEEIIKRRICLSFKDKQSELGKLKTAYEASKSDTEKWKQTAAQLQKQVTELQIVVQRQLHLNKKQSSTPTKVATRSVGLQVHMQSFVIPDSSKTPVRSSQSASNNIKVLAPAQAQALVVSKPDANLAVVNIGNVSISSSLQTIAKTSTVLSSPRLATTVTPVQLPGNIVNRPQLTAALSAPPAPLQRSPISTLGIPKATSGSISILQARNTPTQSVATLSVGSSVTPTPSSSTGIPKVASVITPTRSTVRNLLDTHRSQVNPEEQTMGKKQIELVTIEEKTALPNQVVKLYDQTRSLLKGRDCDLNKISKSSVTPESLKNDSRSLQSKKKLPVGGDVQQNSHTQNMTKAALRILRRFLDTFKESREINEFSPTDLNKYLTIFFSEAKKKDGTDYGPHTLTCIFDSIDRYLRICKYPSSIKRDDIFYTTRETLRTRRRHLRTIISDKKKFPSCIPLPQGAHSSDKSETKNLVFKRVKAHLKVFRGVNLQPSKLKANSGHNSTFVKPSTSKCLQSAVVDTIGDELIQEKIEIPSQKVKGQELMLSSKMHSDPSNSICHSVTENTEVKFTTIKPHPVDITSARFIMPKSPEVPISFSDWMVSSLKESRSLIDIPLLKLDSYIIAYLISLQKTGTDVLEMANSFLNDLICYLKANSSSIHQEAHLFPEARAYINSLNQSLSEKTDINKESTSKKDLSISENIKMLVSKQIYNRNKQIQLDYNRNFERAQAQLPKDSIVQDAQLFINWVIGPPNFEKCNIFQLSVEQLDSYLAQFFTLLNKNGQNLKPDELIQIYDNIDLYLLQCGYFLSIKTLPQFLHSKECILLKCKQLEENLKSEEDDDLIKNKNEINFSVLAEKMSTSTVEDEIIIPDQPEFPEKRKLYDLGLNSTVFEDIDDYKKGKQLDRNVKWDKKSASQSCSNDQNNDNIETKTEKQNDSLKTCSPKNNNACDSTDLPDDIFPSMFEPDISLVEDENELEIRMTENFEVSWEDDNQFKCTFTKTMTDVQLFKSYLSIDWIDEKREIYDIPPKELNQYLAHFFLGLRKKDGSEYEADSLSAILDSLNHFLKQNKYPVCIKEDSHFNYSRHCLISKCKSLQSKLQSAENYAQGILPKFTENDMILLKKHEIMGESTPVALLNFLWYLVSINFGLNFSSDHVNLLWGQIQLREENGKEFLEYYTSEQFSAFMDKNSNFESLSEACTPKKLFPELELINLYKKYRSQRPSHTLKLNQQFYLCVSQLPSSGVWFSDMPLALKQFEDIVQIVQNVLLKLKLDFSNANDILNKELHSKFSTYTKISSDSPEFATDCVNDTDRMTSSSTCLENQVIEDEAKQQVQIINNLNEICENLSNDLLPQMETEISSKTQETNAIDNFLSASPKLQSSYKMVDRNRAKPSTLENPDKFISVFPVSDTKGKVFNTDRLKEVFMAEGHAPNTIIKTLHDVNVFREWLVALEETREMHLIPPSELSSYLLHYFTNLKKRDGTDYEPNSLFSIYFSFDRYLKVHKYSGNIKTDKEFQDCRKLFQERRRDMDAERLRDSLPARRQVDLAFSDDDIALLRNQHLLGAWNPEALLLALWYTNTVLLGIHSQKAHLNMLWGDVELYVASDGKEYLEYTQRASKSRFTSYPGISGFSLSSSKRPSRVFATPDKLEECPIELYKHYKMRRPLSTLTSDSKFYLCPNHESQSSPWFRSIPMGRSRLASIPSTIWDLIRKVKEASHRFQPKIMDGMLMSNLEREASSSLGSPTVSSAQLPVPMRLIQNQAAAKQASPVRLNNSNANSSGVKFIDLTADEDETSNNHAQSVAVTSTTNSKLPTLSTQGQVTLIAAGTQGQTLPTGPIIFNTTPVTSNIPVSNSSNLSVRMPSPLRVPQPSIVTQAIPSVNSGQRVTYLVPSTAVMRPPQQVYITSGPQPRAMQPVTTQGLMRTSVPTLVFQKFPVQTSGGVPQVQPVSTSQAPVRPVGQPQVVRPPVALSSAAINSQPEAQLGKTPSPNPPTKPGNPAIGPTLKPPASSDSSNNQAIVVSRITPKHPAPLPASAVYSDPSTMKALPPKPALKISKVNNGIVLSWNMSLNASHADIASYQLFAYQEGSAPPNTNLWKKVGDVKALPLPMACTLTQFMEGHKYHFAVRAVDVHNRIGQFSDPGSIVLCSNNTSSSNSSGIRV